MRQLWLCSSSPLTCLMHVPSAAVDGPADGVETCFQARLGDEGMRQLRERQAQERRDAAKFGDANAIPLGEKPPTSAPEAAPLEPIPDVEW